MTSDSFRRTRRRTARAFQALLAVYALGRPARAQRAPGEAAASVDALDRLVGRPVAEAHGVGAASLGRECTADGDDVGCPQYVFLGIELGGFYTLLRWISVGGVGGFMPLTGVTGRGGSEGIVEERRQFWHLAAQGRFHPIASEVFVPWAGLELGFAGLRTVTERKGFADGSNGTSTDGRSAAAFGAGAGIDGWVTETVAVSLGGWLLHVGFERGNVNSVLAGQPGGFTSPFWIDVGLGAHVRF